MSGLTHSQAAPHSPPAGVAPRPRPTYLDLVHRRLRSRAEYRRHLEQRAEPARMTDFLLLTPDQPHFPHAVFPKVRWGGQVCFVSPSRKEVSQVAKQFDSGGFLVEEGPTSIWQRFAGIPLPFLGRNAHYFVARKTQLIFPGEFTERFTYNVELVPHTDPADPWVVQKRVPSLEYLVAKLQKKYPDLPAETLERRARKFTEKIFPTFLTREAAILMILQEHLTKPYNRRVPHVIDVEKDGRGFVTRLRMNWLRNGGAPISQMEYARQSADLLRAVHDVARVIHLDLRLDNMVITPEGVGFVDFGSAVRDDENLRENPLLAGLFEELMRTSQIQRMLTDMTLSGHVTSHVISQSCQKVDKAVDFFYLALQFNSPHNNPDLADLIRYDPKGREAQSLRKLTEQILRPADPSKPAFRSAKDILHGIERLQLGLDRS